MNFVVRHFVVGIVCGCVALLAGTTWGQATEPAAPPEYQSVKVPASIFDKGAETKLGKDISDMVRKIGGGAPIEGNEAKFDAYFTRYIFAQMTQTDDISLGKLAETRATVLKNYFQTQNLIRNPAIRDRLLALTLNQMKTIAEEKPAGTPNFHPAVRYNAMIFIGELNAKEAVGGGANATPAVPYEEALDVMVSEAVNPKQLDGVRLAAMVGVLRHAESAAPSNTLNTNRKKYITQFTPMAQDKTVPDSRSAEGHAWLRSRAIDVLAALGTAADRTADPAVVSTLTAIASDAQEPASVRFACVQGLGRMNLASAKMPADELARRMGELLLESSKAQLANLDAEIAEQNRIKKGTGELRQGTPPRKNSPRIDVYLSGGGTLPPHMVKYEQRVTLMQRILKDHARKVQFGLEGTDGKAGAITAPKGGQATYVTKVRDAVLGISKSGDLHHAPIKTFTDIPPEMEDLKKDLTLKITTLDTALKDGKPAPAEPMPATPMPMPMPPAEVPTAPPLP